MTRVEEEFFNLHCRQGSDLTGPLILERCRLQGCSAGHTTDLNQRPVYRNVTFTKCEQTGCSLYGGIVEDVLVDGLKSHTLFQSFGTAFKHVTLRGRVGRIMLSTDIGRTKERYRACEEANSRYYETVDWALDISQAEFTEADIRNIPTRLMRLDPETQAVVSREQALDRRWKTLPVDGLLKGTIEHFLERGFPDQVLVAPKRSKEFEVLLDGIRVLVEEGVAAKPGQVSQ